MSHVPLIRFGANPPAPEHGVPSRVLSGAPTTTLENYYTDATGRFFSGLWQSTPGTWAVQYGEEEFCLILEGRCVLTDASGHAETFGPGDAFVIPKGFEGTWQTLEPLRKVYAIFEPPAS